MYNVPFAAQAGEGPVLDAENGRKMLGCITLFYANIVS